MKPEARNDNQQAANKELEDAREAFRSARVKYEFAIGDALRYLSVRQVASVTETSKSQISRGTFNVAVRTDWGKYMPE